jgi:acyl-CoA thioester hydrolase
MAEPMLTYRGAVYPWQCDHMGHMNVMWYVGKFDEATWNFFGALGLDAASLRANDRGFAAVEQNIAYKRELMAGDIVTIYSSMLEIRDRVIRFTHEMRKTDTNEIAATTVLTAVHLDTKARKATSFSPQFRKRAEALIASAAG